MGEEPRHVHQAETPPPGALEAPPPGMRHRVHTGSADLGGGRGEVESQTYSARVLPRVTGGHPKSPHVLRLPLTEPTVVQPLQPLSGVPAPAPGLPPL